MYLSIFTVIIGIIAIVYLCVCPFKSAAVNNIFLIVNALIVGYDLKNVIVMLKDKQP